MTFSTYASNGPRNLYSAQRMGLNFVPQQRDIHAKRRLTNMLVAGLLVAANIGLVAALVPSAKSALFSVSLPSLSAPQN
ncbi:hypothetical protein [Paragemmobacter straminiformis]|uniref:Uncharacterized protein n=1 Tax=Paragemmobacter straminiformis TaxID=2045119 RepID=A0A842I9K9_9RHOB|nr:hypothetical protein [Gemmobacter straminiformis]MBC2836732.1 hypothetical protein [Gemmobacter straminiformis]